MGVSAGLMNLYRSTTFSYYCSPMIPLMLFTLECRMQGLVGEMVAQQTQEDVEQSTGKWAPAKAALQTSYFEETVEYGLRII